MVVEEEGGRGILTMGHRQYGVDEVVQRSKSMGKVVVVKNSTVAVAVHWMPSWLRNIGSGRVGRGGTQRCRYRCRRR